MELKRVVVTGLGAITPLGNTVEETWKNLVAGKSGAGPITHFNAEKFKTQFACEVKGFNPEEQGLDRKEARKMDLYTQFAIAAARQAIEDSQVDLDAIDKNRVGVVFGALSQSWLCGTLRNQLHRGHFFQLCRERAVQLFCHGRS